ncbi:MAG: hypothetical protein RJB60_2633 [Pseudomonadota bacterium]|jgi:hypothetical protein
MKLKALSPIRLSPEETLAVGAEFTIDDDVAAKELIDSGAAELVPEAEPAAKKPGKAA